MLAILVGGVAAAITAVCAWQFANPNHRDVIGFEQTDDDCIGPRLPPDCDPSRPLADQPACPKDAMPTCDPAPPVAKYGPRSGYTILLSTSFSMGAIAFLFTLLLRPPRG
jgi:hypothetical protein